MDNLGEFITLNLENIDNEHICCAISDKKCVEGYLKKKHWLKEQIPKGYVFKKLNVKHKVFIEYCPWDIAWLPITAPNYMVINCFWVAGQYAGKGYGKRLLQECLRDSEDKDGIVVLTSNKKRPYISDKKFFIKQGFEVCDTAPPYFELLVYKNNPNAINPSFNESAKENVCDNKNGLTAYYSNCCPFTEYYINTVLKELAGKNDIPLEIIKIDNKEQVKHNPSPFSIYSLFYNGKFITHEILSEAKFNKVVDGIKNGIY
ncbi:GNAT family N-acetyltransferase [Clostridium sp. A1-XYC3]|uniref:GNAT family N-acetyltransferase n=1 Tax=Clostridium tanneri TaxID=3037988 RepID=A0ABU4JQE1_9CLOT|nr:GNAT family N-acetyltransferase [Clostridium sp. A1-XYC3]MDW8800347.1 GNAT family N-acetyltransferase [Clostridium sp. A1-XYC3]